MPPKSKVELSDHFNEIVDLLLSGFSPRYVSDYLLNEYDEKISHTAINNYKKKNLNVKAEVKKELIKEEKKKLQKKKEKELSKKTKKAASAEVKKELDKEESLAAATNIKLKDVKSLDKLISEANDIELELHHLHPSEDKYDPYKEDKLKMEYKKLGLQAIKTKHDILKDDNTIDVNINQGLSELFDEDDILRFIDESKIDENSSE